jgi:DNA-binding IclR family transcriptional regulator
MNSPAVHRVVLVLDFLATHPGEQFSLSELCRRLDISKGTGHSMMAALAEHGYVVRHPVTHRFGLGPALIPLGQTADRSHAAVRAARVEAEALADELDAEALVTWATDEEMVILARSGVPRPSSVTGQPGQRLPLIPPMGTVFLAWADEPRIDAWLDRLGSDAPPQERERYRDALRATRERGYAVGFRVEAFVRLSELYAHGPAEIHTPEGQQQLLEVLGDLGREPYLMETARPTEAQLRYLSAPIFGPEGTMVLALSLTVAPGLTAGEIPGLASRLLRSAANVMEAVNGRRPDVAYLGDRDTVATRGR